MSLTYNLPKSNLPLQLSNATVLLDSDLKFAGLSDSCLSKFGFDENELLGQYIYEVFPFFIGDNLTKLQYVLEGLKDLKIVEPLRHETDSGTNFIWNLNPWVNDSEVIIGIVISIEDITEIDCLKLDLLKTKNQLKEKGSIAKIGSWEFSGESNMVHLTSSVKELFNLENVEFIPYNDAINLYQEGESRNAFKKAFEDALEKGVPWNLNLQVTSKTMKPIWVNVIGRPKFKDGKCIRIIGTIQDITDKLNVSSTNHNFKGLQDVNLLFDESPTAMIVIDYLSGKIINSNNQLEAITEFSKLDLLNKSFKSFKILTEDQIKVSILNQLRKNNKFDAIEFNYKTVKSKRAKLRITGKSVLIDANKKVVICSIEEVSKNNKKIELLSNQLKESNSHIDELVNFTHSLSHNLKAHSTNFALLFDFLDQEPDDKERRKLLRVLQNNNIGFSETVSGLREIVAIRENINLKKECLIVNESIYRVEQRLSGMIRKNNVKIINEIPEMLQVYAIQPFLDNALSNIISNAINFRKPNKAPLIILGAKVQNGFTEISIEDNGIGIDLVQNQDKLFKLYSTVGNHIDSRGLGLYLTDYQIKLMKGKIKVESKIDEGSTFKLFIKNE